MCHELLESTQKKEDASFWGFWGTYPHSPITYTTYTKYTRIEPGVPGCPGKGVVLSSSPRVAARRSKE